MAVAKFRSDFPPYQTVLKTMHVWGVGGGSARGTSEALEALHMETRERGGCPQQMPARKGPKRSAVRSAVRSSSWEEGEADKDDPRHSGGVGILGLYNQPVPPGWSQMRGGGEGKTPWSSSLRTPHPMGVALGHLPPWEGPAASASPLLLGVKAVFQLECLGSSLPAAPPSPA